MKIQALHTSQFNPEIETFAVSVDLAPLINIRKDYFLAKSQQQSAHIKLQHSQKMFNAYEPCNEIKQYPHVNCMNNKFSYKLIRRCLILRNNKQIISSYMHSYNGAAY